MLEKCVLTVPELNCNQCFGHICHHVLTSSKQLQNGSFHVVERTRTPSKMSKMKNAHAKRAKILFFIVKYANLWGFCCCRRHGCLSSLVGTVGVSFIHSCASLIFCFKLRLPSQSKRRRKHQTFITYKIPAPKIIKLIQSHILSTINQLTIVIVDFLSLKNSNLEPQLSNLV